MLTEIVVDLPPFPLVGISALKLFHFPVSGAQAGQQNAVALLGRVASKLGLRMFQGVCRFKRPECWLCRPTDT
jgi:hypothetical protein